MPASYPSSVKIFTTYQDQPLPNDVDYASVMLDMYQEIVAIENVLGTTPFTTVEKYKTFAQALGDLWAFKSPLVHSHRHNQMQNELSDDHAQYILASGSRSFTAPISGQPAVSNNHLVQLGQITGGGYITTTAFNGLLATALQNVVSGSYPFGYGDPGVPFAQNSCGQWFETSPASSPELGSSSFDNANLTPAWTLTGGSIWGITDQNGRLLVDLFSGYTHSFRIAIQSFMVMGLPVTPFFDPHLAPHWDPSHASVEVQALGFDQVALKFGDIQQEVMFSWIAIGM